MYGIKNSPMKMCYYQKVCYFNVWCKGLKDGKFPYPGT